MSLVIMLIFSGGLKLIYLPYTKSTIVRINIFPVKVARVMGIALPIFEICVALFLIIESNIYIYLLLLGYLMFFILLNLKTLLGNERKECCCYGKLLKSKLGLGGMLHYFYWLIVLVLATFGKEIGWKVSGGLYNAFYLIVSLLIAINGLLIRMLIESIE